MFQRRATPVAALALLALAAGPLTAAHADDAPDYTVRTLHFDVAVGPGGGRHCDIIGDLYEPTDASPDHRYPAVLTTNGFGGSKDDQAGLAKQFARYGYITLSYSGLGFGGSGCRITLDNPQYDGKAASQLVSFLAGTKAAKDGTVLNDVVLDKPGDPRVGLVGGSYGGQFQFAAASVDHRVDAIVPLITWHDLRYSTFPNNQLTSAGKLTTQPGVAKLLWDAGFFVEGIQNVVDNKTVNPARLLGCPNFPMAVCSALAQGIATTVAQPSTMTYLGQSSVNAYVAKVTAPTLLIQGQADSLFNLQEGTATYQQLRAQHTPVKMIWESFGHSGGSVPGELDFGDLSGTYIGQRALAWFNHYLKGQNVDTGPQFSYFRDWVPYTGNASPAYGTAASFPAGTTRTLYLSGRTHLVRKKSQVVRGRASYRNWPGGIPSSYSEISAVQGSLVPDTQQPYDAKGTYAAWTTGKLTSATEIVGSPTLTVRLNSPAAVKSQKKGAAGRLVLFAKIYDVAPNGTQTLVHRLVSPVRVTDVRKPVKIQLPGIVHQFSKGDRLRVVIAATDASYINSRTLLPVTVLTDHTNPATLTLPIVGSGPNF